MNRLHFRVLALCLTISGMAAPVFAQSPKAEVSGGYQFLNVSTTDQNESMPLGWYFDVSGNLNRTLGIVFQVGGNYKTFEESFSIGGITSTTTANLKVHEFLGGVRLNANSGATIVPFGQVLVGGMNGSARVTSSTTLPGSEPIAFSGADSGTNFGLEAGGGINFGLTSGLGLRAGADYLRVFAEGGGVNLFRFHIGIVLGR